MLRWIGGVLLGALTWWVIGGFGLWLLSTSWPAYAAGEPELQFTLLMKFSRLAVGVVCGIGGGIVTGLVVGRRSWAPWLIGLIFLAISVPIHISLWDAFPIWYHLFYLLTLAPLIAAGAWLVPATRRA